MNSICYKTIFAARRARSFPPLLRRKLALADACAEKSCPLVVPAPRRDQLLTETKNYSAQTVHFSSDTL